MILIFHQTFWLFKISLKSVQQLGRYWIQHWLMSETDLIAMVQIWTFVELTMTMAFRKWMAKHTFESLEDFRSMKIQMKLVLNLSWIPLKYTILKTICGEWLFQCSANLQKNLHLHPSKQKQSKDHYKLFLVVLSYRFSNVLHNRTPMSNFSPIWYFIVKKVIFIAQWRLAYGLRSCPLCQ